MMQWLDNMHERGPLSAAVADMVFIVLSIVFLIPPVIIMFVTLYFGLPVFFFVGIPLILFYACYLSHQLDEWGID